PHETRAPVVASSFAHRDVTVLLLAQAGARPSLAPGIDIAEHDHRRPARPQLAQAPGQARSPGPVVLDEATGHAGLVVDEGRGDDHVRLERADPLPHLVPPLA